MLKTGDLHASEHAETFSQSLAMRTWKIPQERGSRAVGPAVEQTQPASQPGETQFEKLKWID